jgi:hypothetical protein
MLMLMLPLPLGRRGGYWASQAAPFTLRKAALYFQVNTPRVAKMPAYCVCVCL